MAEVHRLKDHRQTIQEALEDECAVLHDQLAGAEKEIRGWRTRYANLARDRQAEAEGDPLWPLGVRLFAYWRRCCDHPRAMWTAARFELCRPFLGDLEGCLRAVAGARFDPFTRQRKNGTLERYNGWELVFRDAGKFESFRERAPKNWRPPDTAKAFLRSARSTTAKDGRSVEDSAISTTGAGDDTAIRSSSNLIASEDEGR